jgi:hypothetical protein
MRSNFHHGRYLLVDAGLLLLRPVCLPVCCLAALSVKRLSALHFAAHCCPALVELCRYGVETAIAIFISHLVWTRFQLYIFTIYCTIDYCVYVIMRFSSSLQLSYGPFKVFSLAP